MSTQTPDDWQTYEDFAAGIDTNRLPQSTRLDGASLEITSGHGSITLAIGADQVEWRWSSRTEAPDELHGRAGKDVVEVAPDTYFIDLWLDDHSERSALTAIVGLGSGRTLTVHTHVRELEVLGEPLVTQTFEAGTLAGVPLSGAAPEVTRELLGKRAFSVYSPNHAYEHVYLNSDRYSWQCLNGVQRGHGDTDLASYWRFDSDQYVFAFREFRIPVASVMFLNAAAGSSTGKFLGLHDDGSLHNGRAGARFEILSETRYPPGYEPI
jgi:hypothetical protein